MAVEEVPLEPTTVVLVVTEEHLVVVAAAEAEPRTADRRVREGMVATE